MSHYSKENTSLTVCRFQFCDHRPNESRENGDHFTKEDYTYGSSFQFTGGGIILSMAGSVWCYDHKAQKNRIIS